MPRILADVFPVKPFTDAMRAGFLGNVTIEGTTTRAFEFDWTDIAVIAAWGLAGLIVAVRTFSWEPRR